MSDEFDKKYPYVQEEHATGCDKMVCAYSLGGERCKADQALAIEIANATAKALGPGWLPKVTQNLGWHSKAISPCGRWKVHANVYKNKVEGYTAFLGEAGRGGGLWAEHGKTPLKAVENTRKKARAEVDYYRSILDMVENA